MRGSARKGRTQRTAAVLGRGSDRCVVRGEARAAGPLRRPDLVERGGLPVPQGAGGWGVAVCIRVHARMTSWKWL